MRGDHVVAVDICATGVLVSDVQRTEEPEEHSTSGGCTVAATELDAFDIEAERPHLLPT